MRFDVLEARELLAAIPNETATGGAGAGTSVTTVPLTTKEVDDNAPELIQPDIDKEVMKYKPEATPVDQLMRHAKVQPVNAMEFGYYAVDTRPENTTLKTKYELNASQTSGRVTLDANNNDIFDVTDTILFPGTMNSATGTENLVVRVVAKADDGKLIVMALNGTASDSGDWTIMPAIAANAKMVRMGRAAGELDVQSPMLEALPKRQTNYCQIFKMQVEESTLLEATKTKEANWNFSDLEENGIYEMRKGIEKSLIFGVKSKCFDSTAKQYFYTTEGIWNQCKKNYSYKEADFKAATFVDLCKHAFTGNSGHNRRVLIGGSDFIAMISKLTVDKQLNGRDTEVVWGITWTKIVTNFGTLYCLHDEVFDQVGMPGNGMIIDPDFLSKRVLKPFNKLDLDLVKSGQRNTTARVLTEIAGVVLKYPEAHCKIIKTTT